MRAQLLGAVLPTLAAGAPALPAQPPSWVVEPTPRVELGASPDDPRDQFGRVVDLAFGPGGTVIVLDGTPAAVRRFAADGSPLPDLGRAGDGPGEFRAPAAVVAVGDSIVVLDGDGRRTVFGPGGTLARDERIALAAVCGSQWNPGVGGLLADGSAVVRCQERLFGRVRGEYRQTVGLIRVPPGAAGVDTLGWFPADSGRAEGDPALPRPYAPRIELLFDDAGGRVFVAPSDRPRLDRLRIDGGPDGAVVVPLRPRGVTPRDLARHREAMLRVGGSANDQRVIREWAEGMPAAERTPVIRSLIAAGPEELWVEAWDRGDDRARWLVLDGTGAVMAEVRPPAGAQIRDVAHDAVLVLWRDAFGVERVRVHGLRRQGP